MHSKHWKKKKPKIFFILSEYFLYFRLRHDTNIEFLSCFDNGLEAIRTNFLTTNILIGSSKKNPKKRGFIWKFSLFPNSTQEIDSWNVVNLNWWTAHLLLALNKLRIGYIQVKNIFDTWWLGIQAWDRTSSFH